MMLEYSLGAPGLIRPRRGPPSTHARSRAPRFRDRMRHSRASTTLDLYQQFVPKSQQQIVEKLSSLSKMVQ